MYTPSQQLMWNSFLLSRVEGMEPWLNNFHHSQMCLLAMTLWQTLELHFYFYLSSWLTWWWESRMAARMDRWWVHQFNYSSEVQVPANLCHPTSVFCSSPRNHNWHDSGFSDWAPSQHFLVSQSFCQSLTVFLRSEFTKNADSLYCYYPFASESSLTKLLYFYQLTLTMSIVPQLLVESSMN